MRFHLVVLREPKFCLNLLNHLALSSTPFSPGYFFSKSSSRGNILSWIIPWLQFAYLRFYSSTQKVRHLLNIFVDSVSFLVDDGVFHLRGIIFNTCHNIISIVHNRWYGRTTHPKRSWMNTTFSPFLYHFIISTLTSNKMTLPTPLSVRFIFEVIELECKSQKQLYKRLQYRRREYVCKARIWSMNTTQR